MNISSNSKQKKDDLIKYLVKSQKELINECRQDFQTQKFQDAVERLRAKNKLQNGV